MDKNNTTRRNLPTCFFIHGFNVKDGGRHSIDGLKSAINLNCYNHFDFDYGWLGLFGVKMFNKTLAKILAAQSWAGDIAISHSNGCAIVYRSLLFGARFKAIFFFSPALAKDVVFPPSVEKIFIFHTKKDIPVRIAKLLPWKGVWGDMGNTGFVGVDSRVVNVDCTDWVEGHSDYFRGENMVKSIEEVKNYAKSLQNPIDCITL